MATQKEAIEHSRLTLRSKRIEVFYSSKLSVSHGTTSKLKYKQVTYF